MDMENIDKGSQHLRNVYRYQYELELLSEPERLDKLERAKTTAAARWQSCYGSFSKLFSSLNSNLPIQKNSFDIYAKRDLVNNMLFETKIRLQRGQNNSEISIQPYVVINHSVVDQAMCKEVFKDNFEYQYGTYHSQRARICVDFDGHESRLILDRINGYKVLNQTAISYASVFLAAIEDAVEPSLTQTEDTLIVLWKAIMNRELNPGYKIL